MHCKYCDVDIDSKTKICPICHEKLDEIDEDLPTAYPEKVERKRRHTHFTLSNIYLLSAAIVFLICIVVNYLTPHRIMWCYIVGAMLVYGLVTIENTVRSRYSIGVKVFVQTLSIVLLIVLVQWLTDSTSEHSNMWAYNYALPVVHMISVLVLSILVACFIRNDRNNLISVIIFSILGFIPLILQMTDVLTEFWPALADAIFSAVVIMTVIIFGHKEIKNEFRRKFHI